MKRMIRATSNFIKASNSIPQLWKEYYAEDAVKDGTIEEDEVEDVLAIKVEPEFTEEDYDLFIAGITQYCRPGDIESVSYAMDEGEAAGFDGGYEVKFKDGSSQLYGWYFGKDDLTEI